MLAAVKPVPSRPRSPQSIDVFVHYVSNLGLNFPANSRTRNGLLDPVIDFYINEKGMIRCRCFKIVHINPCQDPS